jgi:hypothetical protein
MRRLLFLMLAVLLAFGGLAFADNSHNGSMVGTWMFKVTFTYEDGTVIVFRYLQTFNADGVTTLVLPDATPWGVPDARSACVGEWKPTRSDKIDAVVYCLESQALDGWLDKISSRLKISSDGRHVSDPHFSAEWWQGDTYVGIAYGAMEGAKLTGPKH